MSEPRYVVVSAPSPDSEWYQVWLAPWVRKVSVELLSHEDAVVLCERLNRDAVREPLWCPSE